MYGVIEFAIQNMDLGRFKNGIEAADREPASHLYYNLCMYGDDLIY
jgi:hypothetical protein